MNFSGISIKAGFSNAVGKASNSSKSGTEFLEERKGNYIDEMWLDFIQTAVPAERLQLIGCAAD